MPADFETPDPAMAWPGVAHTRDGIAAFRAVLEAGDLDARVTGCPAWGLRELAWHVGKVQRWARAAIAERHPNVAAADGPAGRAGLLAWYDEGASGLLGVLAASDPDAPCWAFGAEPPTVRFWLRRQAHEHAVHAYDAQLTLGPDAVLPIDAALAADGIDEVVTMFFPRQVRLGRIAPLERSLAVRVADGGPRWLLAGDGTDGADGSGPADAEVSGPAEALYLLLWKRIGLDDPRLAVRGDAVAARAVLSAGIVP